MTEPTSADSILETLTGWVESHKAISPETWMDAALRLNQVLGYEHDALVEAQQAYANARLDILNTQSKKSVALADAVAETRPEYVMLRKQQLKVSRIEETIRLAKKTADIHSY